MRSSLALVATAGLVALALTGCASAPTPEAAPGNSSEVVEVSGDFGKTPRVEFPTPVTPEETQCSVVIEGDGAPVTEDSTLQVAAALYDPTTGDEVQTVGYDDEPIQLTLGTTLAGFRKGLTCAHEGSRVVITVAPADALNPQTGEEPETGIVAVFDVLRVFPGRAQGSPSLTRDGFPAVVLAPDGRPGITVPSADPPSSKTEVETLLQGSGRTIESGDTVLVKYTGVLWEDGTVFDSSWEKGAPTAFVVSDGDDSQVIPGFSKAVIGQKVGSQVGVIVAPEDGYGADGNGSVPGDATLFFVVDILGVL